MSSLATSCSTCFTAAATPISGGRLFPPPSRPTTSTRICFGATGRMSEPWIHSTRRTSSSRGAARRSRSTTRGGRSTHIPDFCRARESAIPRCATSSSPKAVIWTVARLKNRSWASAPPSSLVRKCGDRCCSAPTSTRPTTMRRRAGTIRGSGSAATWFSIA